jgi:hypothetical protein
MPQVLNNRLILLLLFMIAWAYYAFDMQLTKLMIESPWGIHQWRQTDGASMALIFFEEGNSLFEPKLHNQFQQEGQGGGEMPLVYYLAGKLYHFIGVKDYIIRWLHFFLFTSGVLFLFFQFTGKLNWRIWSIPMILAAFASPTLMYYSMNFLPDAGAFGLALLGTGFYLKAREEQNNIYMMISIFSFILTGWIKISMLIPFFALTMTSMVMDLSRKTFLQQLRNLSLVILPVLAWYLYIGAYNAEHQSTYFATGIRPIWRADSAFIKLVWNQFFEFWLKDVVPTWMRITSLLSLLALSIFWKYTSPFWRWLFIWSTIGVVLYFLLFYINLYEHDYYFIPLYFPLLFLHIAGTTALDQAMSHIKKASFRWLALFLCVFISYQSIAHAVKRNKKSYFGWYQDLDNPAGFDDIANYLDKKSVPKKALFFIAQDFSSNQKLYFLKRKGWTQLSGIYESEDLDLFISKGASYAVVPDTTFQAVTFLKYNITDTIGYHNGIGIYKIGFSKWWNGGQTNP